MLSGNQSGSVMQRSRTSWSLFHLDLDEVRRRLAGLGDQIVGLAVEAGGEVAPLRELEQQVLDVAPGLGLGPLGDVRGDTPAVQVHNTAEAVPAAAGEDVPDLDPRQDGLDGADQGLKVGALHKAGAGIRDAQVDGLDLGRFKVGGCRHGLCLRFECF